MLYNICITRVYYDLNKCNRESLAQDIHSLYKLDQLRIFISAVNEHVKMFLSSIIGIIIEIHSLLLLY